MSLPSVGGQFRWDGEARAAAADDFGHIIHRRPIGVLEPCSADDIAATTRWAGLTGRRVAARGQGHSLYGRSQVDDGIVVDMSGFNRIHRVEPTRAVVDAGVKWSDLLTATLARGLTPPVLTDYLELSVGGTIAVGGIGGTTYRYGMQSDIIEEMEVVTGEGKVLTCSPHRNATLFDAVRAGLGQCAIVTRATVRLIPAPTHARRYALTYPSLRSLLADERKLLADRRFDYLQGTVLPIPTGGWKYTLDAAVLFTGTAPDDAAMLAGLSDDRAAAALSTPTYLQYLQRLAPLEALLRSTGEWTNPHPWITTYVGDSVVESQAERLLSGLTGADVGKYGRVALSPLRRRAITSPLLRTPSEDVIFALNVLRFPPNDPAVVERMIADNRAIYERVRAAGGTLYPVSAFPMSKEDWKRHYGSKFAAFRDAKQRYDPRDTLTPGYEVF
ncbi:FAD-binding protein [Actinokineospora sp.]|uniref:FAD-binding protein n=1 Tax=Actinokineospora sp. TaxID=1872133 RepID=UPI0040381CFB